MSRRVIWGADAEGDAVEQFVFIGLDSPRAASRFMLQLRATAEMLAKHPGLGQSLTAPELESVKLRYRYVKGFPKHAMYYRETGSGIEVLAVLHASRDVPSLLSERFQ